MRAGNFAMGISSCKEFDSKKQGAGEAVRAYPVQEEAATARRIG